MSEVILYLFLDMNSLKPIELKILKLVCDDKSNLEIAAKIKMSLRYTERLKARLYAKTKTQSGIGLLKWAIINKLYTIKKGK